MDDSNLRFPTSTASIYQCVNELEKNELQTVLISLKQNSIGSENTLRGHILTLLCGSPRETLFLRKTIVKVYNSRVNTHHSSLSDYSLFHQQILNNNPTDFEFENLPFYKLMQTLVVTATYIQGNDNPVIFIGSFTLDNSIRDSINKSWDDQRREYKIQIVLRLMQVGLQENVKRDLPNNTTVLVNNLYSNFSRLYTSEIFGTTQWQYNLPIDVTKQVLYTKYSESTFDITLPGEEQHEYLAGFFLVQKLTWNELLVELKERPPCPSTITKELIKKAMEREDDMGVNTMIVTLMDPLSKKKITLPARGFACDHMHCFDAVQFLQMNEQKQTWLCPLCKKQVKFEDIEVDEFFLNILQSPNLSEECEEVTLLQDGSWSNKPLSITKCNQSNNNEMIISLESDEDEDFLPQKIDKHIKNTEDLTFVDFNKNNEQQEKEKTKDIICITLD